MRSILALSALLLLAPLAHAADVTLNWTAPTANVDGSTPAAIGGYNIYSAPTDLALTALPDTIHGGKALSVGKVLTYTIKAVLPGNYVYAVTAWYCPPTGACTESAQSMHVSTTVAAPVVTPPKPGSPGSVTITVSVSAP